MHGFQIWVNLPKGKKMTQPRYQEYGAAQLPEYRQDGRWVRIIAGEADGRRSPIETTVPTTMLHVRLDPGARASHNRIGIEHDRARHRRLGEARSAKDLVEHQAAVVEAAPASIDLHAGPNGLEVLLLAGVPLGEPVARYGPFVMNTMDENIFSAPSKTFAPVISARSANEGRRESRREDFASPFLSIIRPVEKARLAERRAFRVVGRSEAF